jgi:hypothetical protein
MATSAPVIGAPTKEDRIGELLRAIAVVAAEFGPLFFHSSHGQMFLQTGVSTLATLATIEDPRPLGA